MRQLKSRGHICKRDLENVRLTVQIEGKEDRRQRYTHLTSLSELVNGGVGAVEGMSKDEMLQRATGDLKLWKEMNVYVLHRQCNPFHPLMDQS